jgi:5'-phosphate synthase pdxT subunit
MRIGVLALQGAFIEHIRTLRKLGVDAVEVRLPHHLENLDGLIIPGGESTTIGKLAITYGLMEPLRRFVNTHPAWGTCAGMIFLAKEVGQDQPILGVMDIGVDRNAFGRQVDSFEVDLPFKYLNGETFHAVFIRAPLVSHINAPDKVEILAQLEDGRIVAVRQGHYLATSFHPELTPDDRIHRLFLEMVSQQAN